MTTKAEELAQHLAEAMAIPKEVAIIQQHIEKYGRIVQEAAAKKLTVPADEIRLHAGEMTASEMRTVQAVLGWRIRVIREMPLP